MFEARHALLDFDVDEPIRYHIPKIILKYDFFRNDTDGHSHIFEIFEGCAVIEILDVDGAEAGMVGGDDAVQQHFDGGERSAGGGGVSGVVQAIAADGEADAVDLGFEGADGGDEAAIGDFFGGGDAGPRNEEDSVVASGHAGTYTLGEATDVVGQGGDPGGRVWAGGEVPVFETFSGLWVDDGVGKRGRGRALSEGR